MKINLTELPAPDMRQSAVGVCLQVKFACRFEEDFKPGTYQYEANRNAIFSAFLDALAEIPYIKAEFLEQTFSPLSFGRVQLWDLCYSSFIIHVWVLRRGDRFDYKNTEAGKHAHSVCGYLAKAFPAEINLNKFGTSGKIWLSQVTRYYEKRKA